MQKRCCEIKYPLNGCSVLLLTHVDENKIKSKNLPSSNCCRLYNIFIFSFVVRCAFASCLAYFEKIIILGIVKKNFIRFCCTGHQIIARIVHISSSIAYNTRHTHITVMCSNIHFWFSYSHFHPLVLAVQILKWPGMRLFKVCRQKTRMNNKCWCDHHLWTSTGPVIHWKMYPTSLFGPNNNC